MNPLSAQRKTFTSSVRSFLGFNFLSLLALLSLGGLLWFSLALLPRDLRGEPQIFLVEEGQTIKTIIGLLQEKRLIRSATALRLLIARRTIQAGSYRLSSSMSGWQIANLLTSGQSQKIVVTIPEGFTNRQIAQLLQQAGLATEEEFRKALQSITSEELSWLPPEGVRFEWEGFLFPDTYFFTPQTKAETIVKTLLHNFEKRLAPLQEEMQNSPFSWRELVILASLVEKEGKRKEEMELIASVLLNRLQAGMRLDVDATVRYALNQWETALTPADLAVASPYNTRRVYGLPPGPISNPGLQAIRAVLFAPKTDYYYYLTAPNGITYFAKTLDEHNEQKARYLR